MKLSKKLEYLVAEVESLERRVANPLFPTQQDQRQDSLMAQLSDLHRVASRLGMYDAADWLWKVALNGENPMPKVRGHAEESLAEREKKALGIRG